LHPGSSEQDETQPYGIRASLAARFCCSAADFVERALMFQYTPSETQQARMRISAVMEPMVSPEQVARQHQTRRLGATSAMVRVWILDRLRAVSQGVDCSDNSRAGTQHSYRRDHFKFLHESSKAYYRNGTFS
jgi:hypothetical protein